MGNILKRFCNCCFDYQYDNVTGDEVETSRPPSLRNIGATCYMNSAFQGISSCNSFVKEINGLYNTEGHDALKQLQLFKDLIEILNGRSRSHLEISRNPIFSRWNKFGQQDSYELLAYALNEVYNELRQYKENKGLIPLRNLTSWLQQILPMRLIIQYIIECGCGKITSCPLQSDLALHVTIPMKKETSSLDNLIDDYFLEDVILDYQCDSKDCNGIGAKRSIKLVKPLPRTICIHLQRTYWNGRKMIKINNKVEFKQKLIIKSTFCLDERGLPDGTININTKDDEYDLVSVIVHEGTVNSGHYVCFKKSHTQWFLTNDSSVRRVGEVTLLSCQPYILFYEKSEETN